MAKSLRGSGLTRSSDDDMIKQALKAELEQMKASDELIAETLRRCSVEISKNAKPRSFLTNLMSKPVLRYGATIAAACLFVLVFFVNFPGLFGLSPTKGMEEAPIAENATDSADMTRNAAAAGRIPKSNGADQYSAQAAPSMDTGPASSAATTPEPAPSAAPAPEALDVEMGLGLTGPMGCSTLNSLNSGSVRFDYREYESDQTVDKLIVSYNEEMGTDFTFDANNLITVFSVHSDGVDAETLKNASCYAEILGGGSYRLLPLSDKSGDYIAMLPVFSEPYNDSMPVAENGNAVSDGSLKTYSMPALPADKEVIDAMLNPTRLENTLEDSYGSVRITELIIVDINGGSDFMALITAGGSEYAVPLFTALRVNSLQNGRAYDIRFAFDSLARYLETGD